MVLLPVQPHPLDGLENFGAEAATVKEVAAMIPDHVTLVALPAVELRLDGD